MSHRNEDARELAYECKSSRLFRWYFENSKTIFIVINSYSLKIEYHYI